MNHNKKILTKIISKTKIYLAIIAILLTVICVYNPWLIIPSIIVYVCLLTYAYWTNNKGQEELTEHIKSLTFSLDKVAKVALVNSPFPLVIAETNGNLIFKNTKFNQEFANVDINNYLTKILEDVKLEIKNNEQEENIKKLWTTFFNTIGIKERRNKRCQMNFMPKKYWKYMTEMSEKYEKSNNR